MKIAAGTIVELTYTLSIEGGEVVESSEQEGLLQYMHGNEELPPRLEEALAGGEVGKTLKMTLAPEESFGPYDVEALTTVPRSDLPDDAEFEPDTWIEVGVDMEDEDGKSGTYEMEMRVVEVNPESIVLDANHPLAGKTINYAVEVATVRQATDEDLEERHEHGPDCEH
ncbi:MAG: FKBP-type peptidyl-prolyl cis-trans isomerase [bacterium]|jgi:FKBP-type peptidyl-prolyl cis-trans isomerase SlyD|nr:peptidylprolyl isomerase [Planctomycetota bacterium]